MSSSGISRDLSRWLGPPLRMTSFVGFTAAMLASVEIHQQKVPLTARDAVFDRYMRRWSRGWLRLMGIHAVWVGRPPAGGSSGRLVVSNHRSIMDIPLLLTQFGGSFLSRADLASWPLFGRAARQARTIFVDRKSRRSGSSAIRAMRNRLREGGTVLVFPEGTTFAGDRVRPLRAGAFVAAKGLSTDGIDIVPVGIAYQSGCEFTEPTTLAHVHNLTSRPQTRVAVAFGEPQHPREDVHAMTAAAQDTIQHLVDQARAALEADALS